MHKSKTLRVLGLAVLVAAMGSATFAADPATPNTSPTLKGYMGVAKPKEERIVSYERAGRISEMNVKQDEEVKAGQVLAKLNSEEEEWALKIDEMKAHSEVSINAEKAVREQKKADYDRMNDERVRRSVSATELNAARVEVTVADARIALAEEQRVQDGFKFKQDSAGLEKSKIISPIDGVVATIFLQQGESSEGGKTQAMRIIQNDPLLVEIPMPVGHALKLKIGDAATVRFLPDGTDVRQGKVTSIATFVDIGSQRIVVKVEVPNPQKTPSGTLVDVDFPSPQPIAQK